MGNIVKVADKQQAFLRLLRLADKDNHALRLVAAVDPLETVRIVIQGVHCRILPVNLVERLHIVLHLPVHWLLQQFPIQGGVLIPFLHLGEILPHKQQLFPRMAHHEAVSRPQILRLLLQAGARHLADHRALAVHHLVVGEHQNKVLAVGVEQGEGQLAVVVLAEQRVAAHIIGEIVHPPHIPLEIKAQSPVSGISRNHGPGGGFLRDQHSAVLAALEHGAQML